MTRPTRDRAFPPTLGGVLTLVAALLISSLAVAPRAEAFIYWTNSTESTIGRANLDGTGVNESFIDLGRSGPSSVTVDAHHIYWMHSLPTTGSAKVPPAAPGAIGRARLDGTHIDADFITGFDEHSGGALLAVDEQHIYWTEPFIDQGFYETSIARANLDGTGVQRQYIAPGGSGIAVDADHIYWPRGDAIARANIDGSGIETHFIPVPVPPNSPTAALSAIAVDAEHAYWVNVASGPSQGSLQPTIARANLDGTGLDTGFIADWGPSYSPAPEDVAVDAAHLYWTDSRTSEAPSTIGRADLDGANVDQRFIVPGLGAEVGGAYATSVAVDALADTKLAGKATAAPTQRQAGKRIVVNVRVKAKEELTARATGKVKVNPTYKLKPERVKLAAGQSRTLKLKPKKSKAKRIARALKRGKKAKAKLKVKLTDLAANRETETLRVRLRR